MEFVKTVTEDKLILQAMLFKSNTSSKKLIIHIHGMSGNLWENSFIKQMSVDYPNNNIDFLTVETRGSEIMRWFQRKNDKPILIGDAYEIFEDCVKDIDAWIKFAENYKEIYLQGHSLGSSKIAYAFEKKKYKQVKGLIFISPSDMHGLCLEPSELENHKKYLKEAERLIKAGNPKEILPWVIWDFARLSAESYLNINAGEGSKIFNFYNPKDGFKTINNINIPMLAIVGTKDLGICTDPVETFNLLRKEAKKCPKLVTEIYKDAHHDFEGFEKRITKDVISFMG